MATSENTKINLGHEGLYNATNADLTARDVRKILESLDVIYGFDLAKVILLISAQKISGYLNIISDQNEIYGITFSDGDIVQIDNRDQKTFIGQLLVNEGYLSNDELNTLIDKKSTPFGTELLKSKKITQDQLVSILYKQTVLRLTQLINPKSIQISFTHVDVKSNEIKVSTEQLLNLSLDWTFSCFTDEWLGFQYTEQKQSNIKLNTEKLLSAHLNTHIKLIEYIGKDYIPLFENKKKYDALAFEILPKQLIRLIHQLVLIGCLEFISDSKKLSNDTKKTALQPMQEFSTAALNSIKNEAKDLIYAKKYFEAFSILKKLNDSQMKASKIELYSLWCLLGHAIDSNTKIEPLNLKHRLQQIRPEDKFEAEYFYVMALYHQYSQNKADAISFYKKSCLANPKFIQFPILNTSFLSKFKNVFKFILVASTLFISQKNYCDELQPAPIKFTNQYYNYEFNDKKLDIAGLHIDLNDLNKTINEQELVKSTNCFGKKTENSTMRICPQNMTAATTDFKVLIAGQRAEDKGFVILQDLTEYMEFRLVSGKNIIFEFKAHKRAIAPLIIKKNTGDLTTQFTFIDIKNRKNIWQAELGVNELTFKLESVTESFYFLQDYIYISESPEIDNIEFNLKLPKEVQYSYNRFGLNALAGFSSFVTSTATFNSTLNSAVGYGVKLLYERNLDATSGLYTNLILYSATVSNERNTVVITNKKFSIFDFNVGYKNYLDLSWALGYELNYRNNFTTSETSSGSDQFEIQQSNSTSITLRPEYTFLENRLWNFVLDASPSIMLPQSTTYGATKIGYAWGIGVKTTYKIRASRLYAGINYDDRTFKSDDASFRNKDLIYAVGFYYLF